MVPLLVEVHQHGDDLAFVVGVNIAVGPLAEFAHGDRGGQGSQFHVEALTQGRGEGRGAQFFHQVCKGRAVLQVFECVVGRGFNRRVVGVDAGQYLGAEKARHHHIIEGVGVQFGVLQGLYVEQ